jgi:hypothetical protein
VQLNVLAMSLLTELDPTVVAQTINRSPLTGLETAPAIQPTENSEEPSFCAFLCLFVAIEVLVSVHTNSFSSFLISFLIAARMRCLAR